MCLDKLVYLFEQVNWLKWFDDVSIGASGKRRFEMGWGGRGGTEQNRRVRVKDSDFPAKLSASCLTKPAIEQNQVHIAALRQVQGFTVAGRRHNLVSKLLK